MAEEHLVDGDFYEASYFGISIIYQKSSNYVNATKLCSDCNRHYYHWKSNKQSMVLFHEFSKYHTSAVPPEFQIYHGEQSVRGTYVHPDLVAAIAIWIDPGFHLRVSQLVRSIYDIQLNCMIQQHAIEKEEMEFCHSMELEAAKNNLPPSYYLIMKKNSGDVKFPYKVVQCGHGQRHACLKRFTKEFPNSTILVDSMITTDGKAFHQKVKTSLSDKLVFHNNNLQFLCNERDAVRDILLLINQ
jgi:hypothetical protein